ncbi:MAG: DUF4430 domain-containing protein [Candidatus Liptonbacteria bacterium]|nr:DUF4430 domain-containing protein [Candidatus Liptonbacteria bacterium]
MNKKTYSFLLISALLISFVPFIHQAEGDVSSAVSYLKSKDPNAWVTMALVAAGENPSVDYLKTFSGTKAIDYEAPILALAAAGKNPKTFPNENFITKLKSFYSSNQIGDPSLLNDDIFGILALVSAGEPVSDQIIQDSKTFLLNHQNSNGSWSFAVGASGDTNMTAMAVMALSEVGLAKTDQVISKALDYLRSAQNSDGGFPYDPQSSWSTSSDASSDSWVISALNKIGENPSSWTKDDKTAINHLNSLATNQGYYEFQKGNGEDSFTPVTTAYAVIALLNKSYPVGKISAPSLPEVSYRIAGSASDLCEGKTSAPNPLELVKIVASDCGFTYHIQDTSFGPYLDQIGSDVAQGLIGWLYFVNSASPQVGAVDYSLQANDDVLWYYGDFNWKLTRLTLSNSEIPSGSSVQATVEYFDAGAWHPLEGAAIHFGSNTQTTDASGHTSLSPADGTYQIFATKDGYLRTEVEKLIVGTKVQTSVDLSANVTGGSGGGNSGGGGNSAGFNLTIEGGSNHLDFGDVQAGSTKSKNITLSNQGTSKLYIESSVLGDDLFRNYLKIGQKIWRAFSLNLNIGENKITAVEIAPPSSYSLLGQKSGTLIFWAIPVND